MYLPILSPRLLGIIKKKPVLAHYAIASIGVPTVFALAAIVHSAQTPFNLLEISYLLEPYPHYDKKQKYFQTNGHIYDVRLPVFDHDYNLIREL